MMVTLPKYMAVAHIDLTPFSKRIANVPTAFYILFDITTLKVYAMFTTLASSMG